MQHARQECRQAAALCGQTDACKSELEVIESRAKAALEQHDTREQFMSLLACTQSCISEHKLADAANALTGAKNLVGKLGTLHPDDAAAFEEAQGRLTVAQIGDMIQRAGEGMQKAESVLDGCSDTGVTALSSAQLDEMEAALKTSRELLNNAAAESRGSGSSSMLAMDVIEDLAGALQLGLDRLHALEARKDAAFIHTHQARAEAVVHEHVRNGDYKGARESLVKFTEEMGKSGVQGSDIIAQRLLAYIEREENRARAAKCLQDAAAAIEQRAVGQARALLDAAVEAYGTAGGLHEEDEARVQDIKERIAQAERAQDLVRQGDKWVSEAEASLADSKFDAAMDCVHKASEVYASAGWSPSELERVVGGLTSRVDAARQRVLLREKGGAHLASAQAALGAMRLDDAEKDLAEAVQAYRSVGFCVCLS
jgi:hypothetical protein